MTNVSARLARVRDGLTPREWARTGAMVAVVVGLNVAPVPEPETYALLLAGLGAVGFISRRRRSMTQF